MAEEIGSLSIKFSANDENVEQTINKIVSSISQMQTRINKALNEPIKNMSDSTNKMTSTISTSLDSMNSTMSKTTNSILSNNKKIQSSMKQNGKVVTQSTKSMNSGLNGFLSNLKGIAKFTVFSFLGRQIVNVGAKIFELGSDMSEVENLFQVSFGEMSNQADAFAQRLQDAWGVDTTPIKEQTAYLNQMFKSMNFGTQTAYTMSTELEKLSYNMASLYNISQQDAFKKLQSGMAGQIRGLKSLGVLIDDTTIKQYALNQGIWDGTGTMNQQQKALAR